MKKLDRIQLKGNKYYKIVIKGVSLFIIISICIFMILIIRYYNPVQFTDINNLKFLAEKDKVFGEMLKINEYQTEGSADDYYYLAFNKYLSNYGISLLLQDMESINLSKYLANENYCANRSVLNSFLISNVDLKKQENLIYAYNCILQGAKKKKFVSLDLFRQEIKMHNQLFTVYRLFMMALIKNARKELKNNDNNSLDIIKATYCYLNHFQYNYPESLNASTLNQKIEILRMLMRYYRLRNDMKRNSISRNIIGDYFKFNDSLERMSYSNFETPYNRIMYYGGKILLNQPLISALIAMLLYDIDDLDNAIKVAKYSDFRYFQYNSIMSLGIMKNSFWRPLKSYKARQILKELKNNKDPMTAYLAEIADNIELYDFYMFSYTVFKCYKYYVVNHEKNGEPCEIYRLIRNK